MKDVANIEVVTKFLEVLDALHYAKPVVCQPGDSIESLTKRLDACTLGLQKIEDLLHQVFKNIGVEQIGATIGQAYDVDVHEPLSTQNNKDQPHGVILHVVRHGYKLNNRLIRPVSVIVNHNDLEIDRK